MITTLWWGNKDRFVYICLFRVELLLAPCLHLHDLLSSACLLYYSTYIRQWHMHLFTYLYLPGCVPLGRVCVGFSRVG